jgi:peptide/nickel transport system permease protein
MNRIWSNLRQLTAYPSAVLGLIIVFALLGITAYTLITIPYSEAVRLWRGGEEVWYDSPKTAAPVWTNWFSRRDRPSTMILGSQDEWEGKQVNQVSDEVIQILFPFTFDYQYEDFPQEISVFFRAQYEEKAPHLSLTWRTPDGREIKIGSFAMQGNSLSLRVSQEKNLQRKLGGQLPHIGLFADPNSDPNAETPTALQGTYELEAQALLFEPEADVDAEMVLYGQVHGLAGTDHRRRDLTVALLWGTPVALAFGLLAAVGTTITTLIISGIGTWLGGWVDEVIQRVTEVNMILPFLPILILVGTFYSRSLWLMLGVTVLLSIFGASIKTYRAIFLQVKSSPYIEAAQAYGASSWRIIFNYLVPRIIPMLIPQLVVLIPTFVFIEASLSVLGLGDPVLPTWGKIISEARTNGALYQGLYYWVLEPSVLLMLTGLAFSLLGFSLDRIFNPRLRGL